MIQLWQMYDAFSTEVSMDGEKSVNFTVKQGVAGDYSLSSMFFLFLLMII